MTSSPLYDCFHTPSRECDSDRGDTFIRSPVGETFEACPLPTQSGDVVFFSFFFFIFHFANLRGAVEGLGTVSDIGLC